MLSAATSGGEFSGPGVNKKEGGVVEKRKKSKKKERKETKRYIHARITEQIPIRTHYLQTKKLIWASSPSAQIMGRIG